MARSIVKLDKKQFKGRKKGKPRPMRKNKSGRIGRGRQN